MFINFAKIMININYIIGIYKTDNLIDEISYNIIIKYNDIHNSKIIKECYKDMDERNKRFDEIMNTIFDTIIDIIHNK